MEAEGTTLEKIRIQWIDIYKAICMILVVVGHATGQFNQYFYQFHVAAFFFISGYTSRIWKKDTEKIIADKTRTLWIPLFTMIAIIAVFNSLSLPGNVIRHGLRAIVDNGKDYIISGNLDQMLGAAWFLPTLFCAFLIQRLTWALAARTGENRREQASDHVVATVAVYIVGYYLQKNGYRNTHCFDIALIAQLFFGMGVFVSENDLFEKLRNQAWRYAVYICALLWIMQMNLIGNVVMDFPSRAYPGMIKTAIVPCGGILLIFGLSDMIDKYGGVLTKPLVYIGNNTLGILFLHFVGFKIATLLLIPLGITSKPDLQAFLLPDSAKLYVWSWAMYSACAVLFLYWSGEVY